MGVGVGVGVDVGRNVDVGVGFGDFDKFIETSGYLHIKRIR